MDPLQKTVMTRLMVLKFGIIFNIWSSNNGPQMVLNPQISPFHIYFFKCKYIYNTILCIILHLHQITKNLVSANARVFLMQRLWEGHRSLFWPSLSVSQFFSFDWKPWNEFLFCHLSKWECKKYICGTLPITALQVNPTMTTSAAEKPGNVKKVHNNNAFYSKDSIQLNDNNKYKTTVQKQQLFNIRQFKTDHKKLIYIDLFIYSLFNTMSASRLFSWRCLNKLYKVYN